MNIHNEFREKHDSPKLKINEQLNSIAQEFAKKILDLEGKKSFPSNIFNDSAIGENILISKKITAQEMCQKWYDEINSYDFNLNKYQKGVAHFSQLIWKETKEEEFGYAFGKDNKFCGIAIYYPAGNILGEFSNNVNKAK